MRSLVLAAVLCVVLGALAAPAAAQSASPSFLFLLENRGTPIGTLHVFGVNSATGALTEVPGSPFNAGLVPLALVLDPTGRYLYVANQLSQDITAFSVDPVSGALAELPGSAVPIGAQPLAMGVDPTGRFLYVFAGNTFGPSVYEYLIDGPTGVLTPAANSPEPGIFATAITFDPNGNYAYLSQGSPTTGSSNPITICTIDFATGALTPVGAGQPTAGGSNIAAVTPQGTYLYSADVVTSGLDAFAVTTLGSTITEIAGTPYVTQVNPFSMVVHPAGNLLLVANENLPFPNAPSPSQAAGSVSAYGIDAGSGALTPVSGSPFAAGINPLSVVVDPTGSFAYVSATTYTVGFTGFAQILGYSINPSTGILTPLPGAPWTDSVLSNGGQITISHAPLTANNPVPTISSLLPSSTSATGTPFTLQVNGTNFVPGATVFFGGQERSTTFVSSSQLNASIIASDIADAGTAVVFVFNPAPGGGASTSVEFPISNPAPVITSLTPPSVVAGTNSVSFAVNGTGFVTSSVIFFNGAPLQTTYDGPTVVQAPIPVANLQNAGTANITVTNPGNGLPGGGTSNAAILTITQPNSQPIVTAISPTSATVGGNAFSLTVNGTGFLQGAVVTFHLINMQTTFINSTQLTAAIPASAIAVPGNFDVIVNNPNGFASPLVLFSVANPAPGGGTLTPPSAPAGSNALLLTVTGTGFTAASVVMVNGSPRATTFVNATTLQAMLLRSDLAQPGALKITVVVPPPGGGTSPILTFPVTNLIPQVSSLSPPSAQVGGSSVPLQVTGSNFETSSLILVNSVARVTTYVNATTLSATLSQSDLSVPGMLNIAVINPAPGGGTTPTLPFTVTTAVPQVNSLSPQSSQVGSKSVSLQVIGSNFEMSSKILVNGVARPTTYVNAAALTMTFSDSDLASPGTLKIAVLSDGPGGGTSPSVNFLVNSLIPAVTHLVPENSLARSNAFPLQVIGSNFQTSSIILVNNAARVTTFVNFNTLSTMLSDADLSAAGILNVAVMNPTPGGGTTSNVQFTVQDYTVTWPEAETKVTAGVPANFTFTLMPDAGGFSSPVTFAISPATPLPPHTEPLFLPSPTVTPNMSPQTVTLSISTSPHTATSSPLISRRRSIRQKPGWRAPLLGFAGLCFLFFGLLVRSSRRWPPGRFAVQLLAGGLFVALGICFGCGAVGTGNATNSGGGPSPGLNPATGTPAGTYTIGVTATSGSMVHSTTVTLQVM